MEGRNRNFIFTNYSNPWPFVVFLWLVNEAPRMAKAIQITNRQRCWEGCVSKVMNESKMNRGLKNRHLQLISLGGVIGSG